MRRHRSAHTSGLFQAHQAHGRLLVAVLSVLSLVTPSLLGNVPRATAANQAASVNPGQPTGLPITFTAAGNCSVSTSTVTLTAAGSCTITAHQDGNDTYNPADPVSQTFQIAKASTSVTVNAPSTPYNDPVTLSAQVSPASLAGQTLTGTVQFAINGTSAGSAPIDSTGLATNAPVTITQAPGTYTVTASFTSSNSSFKDSSGSTTLTVTKEDTTLTYSGDTSADYNDSATLKARLLEDGDSSKPLASEPISFKLGSQSCTGTTGNDGVASCTITPTQAAGSSYTASASFAGDGNYQSSTDGTSFTIKPEETAITYTGPKLIAQGRSATLSAILKEDGTTPIAGRALSLTLGSGTNSQSCTTGATDANGAASCTIASVNQPFGTQPVTASFAGDQDYQAAKNTSQQTLIFGYLASGSFVLGDTTAASALSSGASVTWWGAQWAGLNHLSGGTVPDSFKGFAANPNAMPPVCGGTWTAGPGNSPHPPDSVPAYMAVIVSSKISKSGSTISGDIPEMAIVKTDAGYAGNPGHAGTGTVAAVLCSTKGTASQLRPLDGTGAGARHAPAPHRMLLRLDRSVAAPRLHAPAKGHGRWTSQPALVPLLARQRHGEVTPRGSTGRTSAPAGPRPVKTGSHLSRRALANSTGKLDQKIIFDPLPDKTFGDPPFQVSATSVTVTTPLTGATVGLAPTNAGPDVTGTSQTLQATLLDRNGSPVTNATVTFTITGANASSETATTDTSGVASFTYTGIKDGTDSVQASATDGFVTVQSNTATVNWITPVQPVTTTTITGQFFGGGAGYFSHTPADKPAFIQSFPTIDFNPPGGTVPHAPPTINTGTRPFTDVTTDVGGNYSGAVVAQGNGYQAGVGDLGSFDAVFKANFAIAQAGDITFNVYSDDGFIFGVGNGATRVGGADVNPPSSGTTPFQKYPIMGAFNVPTSPVANSITVHFPAPGTYPYEIDYSECCGGEVALTAATSSTGHGIAPAGNLSLTPVNLSAQPVGQTVNLTVAAMDASGRPIANLPVTLNVTGTNGQQVTGTTDDKGLATLSYVGMNAGTDHAQVGASVNGMPAVSNLIDVPWTLSSSSGSTTGPPPPAITDVSPADGSVVTKPLPVSATFTPPQGQSITSWKVTYQALDPEAPVTLASGTGTPPSTLTTFDPTLLPNDTYAITVSATASNGATQNVTTTVAVSGNLKLGRYVTTFQDLSVPVNGFQMQVRRTYDSYDKRVGDFGVGWHVELSNFRVSANRHLGEGGWTMYNSSCAIGLCTTAFRTSAPHYVTVTWPDGHQEIFDFTPTGGGTNVFPFGSGTAAFTARPGTNTTSTLQAQGDTSVSYQYDGNLYGSDGQPYNPTQFKLTTHDGRVFILDTHTGLVSETDRDGNSLTVDGNGVHSSSSESITYTRDASHRITSISGPSGQTLSYTYDGNGDLSSSTDPDGNTTTYAYTGDHLLASTTGPGQVKPFEQEVYDPVSGRLTEVIDGDGHITKVSNDVGAQQQVVTDPAGKLTTVYSYDDRGDLIQRDQSFGGKTLTDTYTYDADGRPLNHTDPLGHVWAGVYDSAGDLTQVTSPASHSIGVSYDSFGNPLSVANPLGKNTTFSYDAGGNLTGFTDAVGHSETYSYDNAGNEVGRKDAAGNSWSGTYDGAGHLVSETDPLGHTTTYTYDISGNMTSMTDALGDKTTYAYDANGNLLSKVDPLGHTTHWVYDSLGQVVSRTDADGSVTTYAYDGAGHLVSTKDPLGHTTTNTYDADGRLASTTDPAGGVTSYTYDGAGRLTTTADPVGRVTSYQYDDAGRLLKTTLPNGGTDTVTYDADVHRLSETDPMGRTTSYTYDANGRLTGVTDPLGHTTTYQLDATGQRVGITDALGETTTQSFDALGRLLSVTDPTNATATTVYDAAGRIVARKDPLGRTTTFTYDAADRLVSTTDPAGHTTSYGYDAAGNLTSETDPLGNATTYSYDPMGRQTGITDPLGHTTTTAYDAGGRQTAQTDPRGATTHYAYDAAGNLTALTDALGGTVSSTYDPAGERTSLTDPLGHATHFTFDPLGNVASETDPLGRVTKSTYDLDGELTSRTDGRGDTTTSSYDAAGHLTSTSAPGFSATYAYDALGQRTSMTDPSGTTTYVYDAAGRVTMDASHQGTITYSYDAAGQRAAMTLSGARSVTYTHGAAANLTGLTDWAGHTITFGYDADGRPTSITRPNGVTTSYGYDAAGNIVTLNHDGHSGALGHYAYTYDAANNRTSVTSAAGTETYTLDDLGRLTSVSYPGGHTSSYTYDATGNRTSATIDGTTTNATYDAAGELTTNGSTAYTYDGAGNLLTAGSSSFTWDGAGHLTKATVGGTTSTYGYNGDGLRVSASTGSNTTPYLWDSQGAVPTLVDDGTNSYLQANGVQAQVGRSNDTTYTLDDALGSVRTLTDATGSQIGTASYDAFGATSAQTGTASIIGFTGQQTDPTGLLYLRARYLDPQLGQFLSADSLQPSGPGTQGYNRYAYVGDNPTTAVDPSGHMAFIERALLSGAIGAGLGTGVGLIFCQHGATYSKCVLRNTLLGLVGGLAGGLVPFGGLAGACVAGAVGSGTSAAVGDVADGNLDLGDLAKQAAIGCGIGGITHGIVNARTSNAIKSGNTRPTAIGFAPGEGQTALTPNRIQHAARHLSDVGLLPPWRGSTSPQLIKNALSPILEAPTATFDSKLGGLAVKGFLGSLDGKTVVVFVYKEGPNVGQIATAYVPDAKQLKIWGF